MARPTDKVLASRIALPPNPCISYVLFIPDSTCIYPHDSIEHARRSILSRNHISSTVLDALLTSVHIGPEPFIYVFSLTAQSLDSLHFNGLAGGTTGIKLPFWAILINFYQQLLKDRHFRHPAFLRTLEHSQPFFLF